jgi:hypothetical protein
MVITNIDRCDYYYSLEQQTRIEIRERTEDLWATAEYIIDKRIGRYPRNLRRHRDVFIEQLFRDLCDEDLTRKKLIDNQQLYLRLAQAYKIRSQG